LAEEKRFEPSLPRRRVFRTQEPHQQGRAIRQQGRCQGPVRASLIVFNSVAAPNRQRRDRGFESGSLQRRVCCEPDSLDQGNPFAFAKSFDPNNSTAIRQMGLTLLLQGKPEAAMPYELWVSGLPQRPPRVWRRRATYPQLLHHLKGHRVPSRFVLEFDWRSLRLDEGWPRTARGPAHHVQTAFADPAIIPDHRKRVRRGRVLAALDSALPTRDRGITLCPTWIVDR
jgi:hypothetical protein